MQKNYASSCVWKVTESGELAKCGSRENEAQVELLAAKLVSIYGLKKGKVDKLLNKLKVEDADERSKQVLRWIVEEVFRQK